MEIEVKIPEEMFKRHAERVEGLPEQLAVELITWQVVDMKRHYPNIERPDEFTCETEIWPRSRKSRPYIRHGHPGRPRGHGHGHPVRPKPRRRGKLPPSTRPILRPELIDKLKDRVDVLIRELAGD